MCLIPGFKFPWCAILFIIIEFLVNAITAFCQFVLGSELIIKFIELDIKFQLYFNHLAYILACLFSLLIGCIADSTTGKYPMVIVGIVFTIGAPICSLMVTSKGNVKTSVRQIFYHITRAVLGCSLTTTGVRTALFVEQSEPFDPSELKNYIFLYWMVTLLAYCITALVFIFSVKYPVITFWHNVVVCILIPLLSILVVAIRFLKMEAQPIAPRCIPKAVRNIRKVLPTSQSAEPTEKWDPLVGKMDEKDFYLARRFTNLAKIILPMIAVGVSTFVSYKCMIEYSEMYDRVNKYKIMWFTVTIIFALDLVMLILARLIILPLLEEIRTEKMLTIAMFTVAVPALILCGLLAAKGPYDPIPKYSRIRVYNCLIGQVRLESVLFTKAMKIESGGVLVINLRCPPKCTGKVKITNATDQFEVTIGVQKYKSQTYLVQPRLFRKLLTEDPFFTEDEQALLPDETAQMFFFSNEPDFVGFIRVLTELFTITFDESFNNSVIFDVPIGIGSVAVIGNDNKMMLSNRTEFTPKSSYSVFYFYSVKVMISEMNKDMEAPKVPLILYILIAPALAFSFSRVFLLVTMYHLLALDCPSNISSFIFSLLYACLNFGPIIWLIRGSMTQIGMVTVLLGAVLQLLGSFLLFWIAAFYCSHAKDDEITKSYVKYAQNKLQPKKRKKRKSKRSTKGVSMEMEPTTSTSIPAE